MSARDLCKIAMKSEPDKKRRLAACWLLAVLLPYATMPCGVMANPFGGSVTAGSATFSGGAGILTINQYSDRAIINWQDFSIQHGELTQFIQPSSAGATLNRVTGLNPSSIHGILQANGQIYLVNPNGILIGPTGVINAQSFIASTLDVLDSEFMAGGAMRFYGSSQAKVENLGTITAAGGDVFLIGREVSNSGTIRAMGGTAGLAGGSEVILSPSGSGSGKIAVAVGSAAGNASNSGTIEALEAEIRAAGGNPYALAINNTGIIKATGVSSKGGRIFLTAKSGRVRDAGQLEAVGKNAEIFLKGDQVEKRGFAHARASGGDARVEMSASGAFVQNGIIEAISDGGAASAILQVGGMLELGGGITVSGAQGKLLVQANRADITANLSATAQNGVAQVSVLLETYGIQYSCSRISANGGQGGEIILETAATPQEWRGDASYARHGWFLSGEITATGSSGIGGTVHVLGDKLDLYGASIDVSGAAGGGNIRVGGDFNGGTLQRAGLTTANSYTVLMANATVSGSGGSVVVWSDETTLFSGAVYGRGIGGDGGWAEISGKETLSYGGTVLDLGSAGGNGGRVLFDPKNITVSDSMGGNNGEFVDPHKASGNSFGQNIVVLSNGNVVITVPGDDFAASNAGAVYLFNGITHSLISTLRGNRTSDQVGSGGVTALNNGNFVVASPLLDREGLTDVGALTWGSGSAGVAGSVMVTNSLVGMRNNDQVSSGGITALSNGNFVVLSPLVDREGISNTGAVTWGSGTAGITGEISASNSLVGVRSNDQAGSGGIVALSNGHYLVISTSYDRDAVTDAGAVSWGNGTTGLAGEISATNSLVGQRSGDQVGSGGVTLLSNGNYIVRSPLFDRDGVTDAGAVTWGSAATGVIGQATSANSLVGIRSNDQAGNGGIIALSNGHYLVITPSYDRDIAADTGAVTWGNGTTGISGEITVSNSLVGPRPGNQIGSGGAVALNNGNYVVVSPLFDRDEATDTGAVTWGNGTTGLTGEVSTSNSLVGSRTNDQIGGGGVTALSNGNYVVASPFFDRDGAENAGAVTWGNGTTGIFGEASISNSLVGLRADDRVGSGGITALTGGNYLVSSPLVDRDSITDGGAVTWGNGASGVTGGVAVSNSLMGLRSGDQVGSGGVTALSNGNYIILSPLMDRDGIANAGAVTWFNPSTGITGDLTASSSLVGGSSNAWTGALVENSVAGTVICPFAGDTSGGAYGRVYTFPSAEGGYMSSTLAAVGDAAFATAASSNVTITPASITAILETGTTVVLQANNDIFIASSVTVNRAAGDGGTFTLHAGRSLLINANITTDNGNLNLYANDTAASGVVDAQRLAGAAAITFASGVTVNVGTGTATVEIRSGAGKTYSTSGDITLGTITAQNMVVTNNGPTAGSDILQQSGSSITVPGTLTLTAPNGAITLANSGNNIGTLGDVSRGGTLTLVDTGGLTVSGTVGGHASNVEIATTGNLILDSLAQVVASGVGNVYLAAQLGNFVNNASVGADAISLGTGRWLIYTMDDATMTRGGLVEDGISTGTYSGNPPSSWDGTPGKRIIKQP